MIPLQIIMDGDGAFADLADRKDVTEGFATAVTYLKNGTASGRGSVAFKIEDDEGRIVIAQTTWALLHAAVRAFEARYGAPA